MKESSSICFSAKQKTAGESIKAAQTVVVGKYKLDLDRIVNLRQDIHKNPEVAHHEFRTKQILLSYLTETLKIPHDSIKLFLSTGFTCDIAGTAPAEGDKLTLGIRAELDALPIKEQSVLPYTSIVPGVSHACGHDGHIAILLATADILSRYRHCLPSNKSVRLIFQPAEEGGYGAQEMINEGALTGVNEVYALHSGPPPLARLSIRKEGAMSTAAIFFRVEVKGKGSHGAYPENGKDPITAICQIHNAMHTIISRGVGANEVAVCTVGEIHAGDAENVIPETASMNGSIRVLEPAVELTVTQLLTGIVENVSTGLGCSGKVTFRKLLPSVINARAQAADLRRAAEEVVGEESVDEETTTASDDFAHMADKLPGAFMLVGCTKFGQEQIMNHSPLYNFNDEVIAPAVLVWLKLAEHRLGLKLPQEE